jgi:SAM-dependent methyltransferase
VHVVFDIAKHTALLVPPLRRYYERRRRTSGREVMKHPVAYPQSVFDKHRRAIEKVRPLEGRVLEIGPGGNVAVAALLVKHGAAEAVCIDSEPWLADNESLYEELGLDAGVLARVEYVAPCPIESVPFEDESFDIVFSHACLEHVADPAAAVASIARVLRPGGVTTHEIDLRDHRDFSNPLRLLKHRDLTWKLAMSRRPAAANRWRMSDFRRAFEEAGLGILDLARTEVTVTEEDRRSFAPRFRALALDDLGTTVIFLTAAKR